MNRKEALDRVRVGCCDGELGRACLACQRVADLLLTVEREGWEQAFKVIQRAGAAATEREVAAWEEEVAALRAAGPPEETSDAKD